MPADLQHIQFQLQARDGHLVYRNADRCQIETIATQFQSAAPTIQFEVMEMIGVIREDIVDPRTPNATPYFIMASKKSESFKPLEQWWILVDGDVNNFLVIQRSYCNNLDILNQWQIRDAIKSYLMSDKK